MKGYPISLLYFSNEPIRGGAEEHLLTLIRGLDRTRFRPLLVCPFELAEKLRPDLPQDVEVFPLCLRRLSQFDAMLRLARILRDRQVKILHSHLFFASILASPIGWACGVPVIVETPHVREHWRSGWLKSRFFVDRFAGRFVTHYIAVSEANKRYLVEQKHLPQEKITVILNGSDLRRFRPEEHAASNLRQSLGFGSDDPVLMVVARLEPQKGHRVLLGALPAIRREFPSVRLVCSERVLCALNCSTKPGNSESRTRSALSDSRATSPNGSVWRTSRCCRPFTKGCRSSRLNRWPREDRW